MNIRPVTVIEGYKIWSQWYDSQLTDTADGPILSTFIKKFNISTKIAILDICCGTGRNMEWLMNNGLLAIADGIDVSEEMIRIAQSKGIYNSLYLKGVQDFIPKNSYNLAICVLAACHIKNLDEVYKVAKDALVNNGEFWLVDIHPFMYHSGKRTRVPVSENEMIEIQTYNHDVSDHIVIGREHGLLLDLIEESFAPESWAKSSPNYKDMANRPLGIGYKWKIV